MRSKGFTLVELMAVVGIIAILMSLLLPALFAHLEGQRIRETEARLRIIEAALAEYQRVFDDFPPSDGPGNNTGSERLLAALRSREAGGPFIKEHDIRTWLVDTDGDGEPELGDPWKNPWIYIHRSDYAGGVIYYVVKGRRVPVERAKKGEVFENPASYQLWACGPNKTDETGLGDDISNLRR